MKKKRLMRIILILNIFCTIKVFGQTAMPDSIVSQWAGQKLLEHASVGICLKDAATGEQLASYNSKLSLIPASTLKLVTTAAALEIMGPDYRFSTSLTYKGTVSNDSLKGDLIIVGGGDPALGSRYFRDHYLKNHFLQAWVDSLKKHNICHIDGNILTDATIYDDQPVPDTWIWEDMGNYYGAGVSALSVYDNTCEIHLWSSPVAGHATRILAVIPEVPGLSFENRVVSSNDQRDLAYVFGSPLDSARLIRGSIPKGKNDFVIRASIPDPARLLAWQLKKMLESAGISFSGEIKKATAKTSGAVLVAVTWSPALIDIIRVTNHESINLFAEHLLRHLSWLQSGKGTTDEGTRVVTDFWKGKGIDVRGFFMCDGSGLSHFNAITSEQMVSILTYMKNKSPYADLFFNSLPAAPEGTLYYFDAANFPGKSLRAKSGSMTRVRCYAGLLRSASGRQILFDIALNHFSCSQNDAIRAIEKLLVSMSRL